MARLARLPGQDETVNVVRMSADAEKEDAKDTVEQPGASLESDVPTPNEEDGKDADTPSEAAAEEASVEDAASVEKLPVPPVHSHPAGAAWANGFVRVERALTWLESRLLFVALMALIASLVFWISLRGMSAPVEGGGAAGTVFRMFVGAAVLGVIARVASVRLLKLDDAKSSAITFGAVVVGVVIASSWRAVGVTRADAILNWLQEGSVLNMVGGLRGLSTRLTIVVAMLGGALAAARSKHINIDVFLRFMRPSWRVPVNVLGALATAVVCFISAYGFVDYTSIEGFEQNKDATISEKIAGIRHKSAEHRFVFWKQAGLDLRAMPVVVFQGVRWDDASRMNGKQWNAWLDESGFSEHFTREQIDSIKAPSSMENESRLAFVVLPGDSAKNVLVHDLNLVWPLGLFWIGLRTLLRALLVVAGHASVEPDADEPDEGAAPATQQAAVTEAAR